MGYYYLYDSYLQDRSYAAQLIKLETTLTDLGIQGKVGRLTLLKSVRDLIDGAVRDGADTVVAVGNDITASQVASALVKHKKITMGIIPIGSDKQSIAGILGIPAGLVACQALSSRIVAKTNMGRINSHYFIGSVAAQGTPLIEFGGNFLIRPEVPHEVRIVNLDWLQEGTAPSPDSGTLQAVLTPLGRSSWWIGKKGGTHRPTILPFETCRLSSTEDEIPLVVDNYKMLKTPATVSVVPGALRVIVGKHRVIATA